LIFNDDYLLFLDVARDFFAKHGGVDLSTQLIKLQEETGEAAASYIGLLGANPRKGVTHTARDVADELADVAITALIAIKFAGFDPDSVMAAQAIKTKQRLAEWYEENGRPEDEDPVGDDG